jgi:hypothetical protein
MVFPCVLNRCRRDVDADYSCCQALLAQKSNAVARTTGTVEHASSLYSLHSKSVTIEMKLAPLCIEDVDCRVHTLQAVLLQPLGRLLS